jgi:hypothetical protein
MAIPPQRLVISSISTGLQTYDKPFLLNNDAFPTLENALCWRKRLIKKTGSAQLGRLERAIGTTGATPFTALITPIPLTEGTSSFVIGSVILSDADTSGGDPVALISSDPAYSGTLNRTTGALTINIPAIAPTTVQFRPGIPVMGIEEFESDQSPSTQIDFPLNVYFDTVYSYTFNGTIFVDNSFYKNTGAQVTWHGQTYQQFDSSNYFRAMFVTNNVPGAHFVAITGVATGAVTTITAPGHGFPIPPALPEDIVFINEVQGVTNLNGFGGKITAVIDANNFTVTTTTPTGGAYTGGGIVQELTRSVTNGAGVIPDGIRWFDGPGSAAPGTPTGFVNFSPPLDNLQSTATTYLVGCRIIIPFGNRLLAIGTFESNSATILAGGTPVYFGNRIRYCEVTATPFYANAPANVGVEPKAWASAGIQGFGGSIDLDTTQRIITAAVTQGSLILGLESEQRRLSNTGIETDPFTAQLINPDYGSAGTHAIVPMDKGILTVGEYGFIIASSYDAKRFDLPIIQQIFQINPNLNGYERICGGRDFVNEVIYFSYPSIFDPVDTRDSIYPDTTLVFNYRDNNFALWFESATTYGLVKEGQEAWTALTDFTWETWDIPWNSPVNIMTYPFVAFGTPQGFIMLKWANESTNDSSITIQAISTQNPDLTYSITSINHNLFTGAYVGFFPPGSAAPSFIGQVAHLGDGNNANPGSIFSVNFDASASPGSIIPGTWECSIVDQPYIQTKQFPFAWSGAQKTRIGAQKYFLDKTDDGEFTVQILGDQSPLPLNDNTMANPLPSLISNAIVRTRPDDSLGLNDNAIAQSQIWHRLASSCIGDTVQLQMLFSDAQMRNVNIATSPWQLHVIILDLYPSRILA